jgi:hypothetical protein
LQGVNIGVFRIIIVFFVVHGCEPWSFTLWEERRRKVFENKVVRQMFGAKRVGVTGEWENYIN